MMNTVGYLLVLFICMMKLKKIKKYLCFIQYIDKNRMIEMQSKTYRNTNTLTGLLRGSSFYQLAEQMLIENVKESILSFISILSILNFIMIGMDINKEISY